ncbi:MAG: GNAT family N-acetyltransferase [Xanthobacteraceae bacterium]|nr:GNAT family N-acetyltransferase [Xanthobacteraceae bacterium]
MTLQLRLKLRLQLSPADQQTGQRQQLHLPYAELPNDWNRYLEGISTNTRQKIRRFLRQVESSEEFRVTCADRDTVDRDIKMLLRFWAIKWAPRKGDRTEGIVRTSYATLMRLSRVSSEKR